MKHWQRWCTTWPRQRSNPLSSNVAEILPDTKWNQNFRCRDLLSINDHLHVFFSVRTGLRRRCIAHWRSEQNKIRMSVDEQLDCNWLIRKFACHHSNSYCLFSLTRRNPVQLLGMKVDCDTLLRRQDPFFTHYWLLECRRKKCPVHRQLFSPIT